MEAACKQMEESRKQVKKSVKQVKESMSLRRTAFLNICEECAISWDI